MVSRIRFVVAAVAMLFLIAELGPALYAQGTGNPCQGIVRQWVKPDGSVQRMRLVCPKDVECPNPGDRCRPRSSGNHHGGKREWCGCDRRQEPLECHIVIITPGKAEGGGPKQVVCAGPCPNPDEICDGPFIVEERRRPNGGLVQDLACECL